MALMVDYHGFGKLRLPDSLIGDALVKQGLTSKEVQVEIVCVSRDLTSKIHHHEHSDAYVVALGWKSCLVNGPHRAKAYRNGEWQPIEEGDEFAIPAKTKHGFTVEKIPATPAHLLNGILYFLSVQSPPIVGADGHDDYIRT